MMATATASPAPWRRDLRRLHRRTDRRHRRARPARRVHHRHRPALRQLARRRAHPVRPRHARARAQLGGSRGFITDLRGTADGTLIATLGGDHAIILYDVATGVRIGTPITIPDDQHNFVSQLLDGRWLALGGEVADGDDTLQVWDLDPERWSAAAWQVAGRNLTPDEWASNIGELAPTERRAPPCRTIPDCKYRHR
jgi:hypothetical protein